MFYFMLYIYTSPKSNILKRTSIIGIIAHCELNSIFQVPFENALFTFAFTWGWTYLLYECNYDCNTHVIRFYESFLLMFIMIYCF